MVYFLNNYKIMGCDSPHAQYPRYHTHGNPEDLYYDRSSLGSGGNGGYGRPNGGYIGSYGGGDNNYNGSYGGHYGGQIGSYEGTNNYRVRNYS